MPANQNELIARISEVQPNVVVVLHSGSPIAMPWLDKVAGVLQMYLAGQASGGAAVNLLFGDATPCGKLAETFPLHLEDNPSYLNFPGNREKVCYQEGVFTAIVIMIRKRWMSCSHLDTDSATPILPTAI